MVQTPGATAGIEAGTPTSVWTAGCEVMTEGWAGMEVAAAGPPVMTPSEFVSVRYLV